MPSKQIAVDWVHDTTRTEEELRRACTIMELHDDGDLKTLRARLNEALAKIAPQEEVVCLNPLPIRRRESSS